MSTSSTHPASSNRYSDRYIRYAELMQSTELDRHRVTTRSKTDGYQKLFGLTGSSSSLRVSGSSNGKDIGDSFSSAQNLGNLSGKVDSNWRGAVGATNNRDVFRFNLSNRSKVSIGLNGYGGTADLRVFRSNGSPVNLSQKSGELRGKLSAGTYYAEVSAVNGEANYTLKLKGSGRSLDPGSSGGSALDAGTLNGVNRSYQGSLSKRDTADLYRFTLDNSGSVNLNLRNASRNAEMQLFDSNGSQISSGTSIRSALAAGTYFARVSGSSKAKYSLDLSATGGFVDTPIDNTPSPTGDPGNFLRNAEQRNSPNFSRQERVDWNDADDLYRISVNQSGVFTANLTGLTGDADVKLVQDKNNNGVIDSGETVAHQWERGTANESIRQFINAGNYFVQVSSHKGSAADYTLNTSFNATGVDSKKFSIQLNYNSGLDKLGNGVRNALNRAASYWESVIPSSTFNGKHTLNIDVTGVEPAEDWYAVARSTGGATDANGKWMPTQGTVRINTRYGNTFNQNSDYFTEVLIHEFAHVLGIGTLWEKNGRNFVDRFSNTYSANTYAGLAYGELLGKGATSVPVEAGVYGHWDENKLGDESLTPIATQVGVKMPMSQITLASLRDIGWNVNYGAAASADEALRAINSKSGSIIATRPPLSSSDFGQALRCACSTCLTSTPSQQISLNSLGASSLSEAIAM
jgi:hypothetical protein